MDCFKAYDIRGIVPDQLNEDVAYGIGRAFLSEVDASTVCVGRDIRLSSDGIAQALMQGLCDGGADVFDIGLCGTEEVYFHTFHKGLGGGIMVTASHNPANYNGMKIVREQARPVSRDNGLFSVRDRVAEKHFKNSERIGHRHELAERKEYVDFLLNCIAREALAPLKILANPGNGCAGPVVRELAAHLPFSFQFIQEEPDGTFPNGIPNPLLPDRRADTSRAVVESGSDIGLAWDGDFDRCFFFDERGEFIEGYYLVGLLAQSMLSRNPGAKIIHDPRLTWNTVDIVTAAGGIPVVSKTGHAFIKDRMREEDAIYGGEMSAHHYFRDFGYCDSGMIPWLLVCEILSRTRKPLSALVDELKRSYPVSGEINLKVADPLKALAHVEEVYRTQAQGIDKIDGLSVDLGQWRFNLRCSNTEPIVRLNVEAKANETLMNEKTAELLRLLELFAEK
ncbi:phosphomannomutase [Oceanidesulfovibrio marinus]|uniref:Phosphomannomutase n=1 Tax=Oceanidesulfovibrio marinus TaxID=370038 RepID=A0A6P1ZK47_9BACT|nr:phosphomannomutase [Oceanidesulfovibrio marinus]TVM36091.1 phosphomannomutase [Oceanidesulfovibrio marinus]